MRRLSKTMSGVHDRGGNHDRYWRARGVQTRRCGVSSSTVERPSRPQVPARRVGPRFKVRRVRARSIRATWPKKDICRSDRYEWPEPRFVPIVELLCPPSQVAQRETGSFGHQCRESGSPRAPRGAAGGPSETKRHYDTWTPPTSSSELVVGASSIELGVESHRSPPRRLVARQVRAGLGVLTQSLRPWRACGNKCVSTRAGTFGTGRRNGFGVKHETRRPNEPKTTKPEACQRDLLVARVTRPGRPTGARSR